MRERFVIYAICFSILMGGSVIGFLLGVATNKDACFIAALVLFFMGLLLAAAWARISVPARWLLTGLLGLTLLMGVIYALFLYERSLAAKNFQERVMELEKVKAVHAQRMASEPKPGDETVKPAGK